MPQRARNDAINQLCRAWGRQRRKLLGLDNPELARDHVGAIRSTLGQRRDLHAGSRSNKVEQHWPEVYVGDAQAVNFAFWAMRPYLKAIMDVQFVLAIGDIEDRAKLFHVSRETYLRRVADARHFVEGWLARATPSPQVDLSMRENRV